MNAMRFLNLRSVARVCLWVTIFFVGFSFGYNGQPAIGKVSGLTNLLPDSGSTSPAQLGTCLDERGTQVPCLLEREGVHIAAEEIADFGQFWEVWNIINEKYVPPKDKVVTNQEKVWGAASGLADALGDPYTYFMPPQEKSIFEQDVAGSFGGVGMQIGIEEGMLTAIGLLPDSPAERAGIRKGDRIYLIDGATTTEMTIDKALYLIRGEVGKAVLLTVLREGVDEPIVYRVVREVIQVPTIETKKEDDVFIISLYGFPATGADLFRNALREFLISGADKLVIDLRGNPGGYLEVAVDMASWFLPQGAVVVSEEDRDGVGRVYRSKGYNIFKEDFHVVVLVDGGSASASEILAGALEQHGVATLVGTKTFGKGSVQELVPVTDDTALKVTVARWIMPNGKNLSSGGIDPNVLVEYTQEDADNDRDPQLDAALKLIRSGKFPPRADTLAAPATTTPQ